MPLAFADIAFTPSVRAVQETQGSAQAYAKFLRPEAQGGDRLSEREATFISRRDGFYQSTVSETGWPYVQYRGGPSGFLKVIDDKTIAYADFRGNRQYLSVGNLAANDRVSLILMDYPNRQRLKIWGRVKLVDAAEAPGLMAELHDETYRARPERAVVITIEAFDWNCPQHIPRRFTLDEIETDITNLHEEIAQLRAENERLEKRLSTA